MLELICPRCRMRGPGDLATWPCGSTVDGEQSRMCAHVSALRLDLIELRDSLYDAITSVVGPVTYEPLAMHTARVPVARVQRWSLALTNSNRRTTPARAEEHSKHQEIAS